MQPINHIAYSNTFKSFNHRIKRQNSHEKKYSPKAKKYALVGTAVTTVGTMMLMRNKSKSFLKGLIDINYDNAANIIKIGLASITGGLAGGLISKEGNNKKKYKESIHQAVTNIICPTILAEQSMRFFNNNTKLIGNRKKIATGTIVIGAVGIGMAIGRSITKIINSTLFKNDQSHRKTSLKDVLIHIDDVPLVFGITKEKLLGFNISQLIPIAAMFSGVEAGKQ